MYETLDLATKFEAARETLQQNAIGAGATYADGRYDLTAYGTMPAGDTVAVILYEVGRQRAYRVMTQSAASVPAGCRSFGQIYLTDSLDGIGAWTEVPGTEIALDFGGETPVTLVVDPDWVADNGYDASDPEAFAAAMNAACANGLAVWQNYVLGNDPKDANAEPLKAVISAAADGTLQITKTFATGTVRTDTGLTAQYVLEKRADAGAWAAVGEPVAVEGASAVFPAGELTEGVFVDYRIVLAFAPAAETATGVVAVPSANTVGACALKASAGVATILPVPYTGADGGAVALSALLDQQGLATDDGVRVWTGAAYEVFKWTGSAWKRENAETAGTGDDVLVPVGHALRFVPAAEKTVRLFGDRPATLSTALAGKTTALLANPTSAPLALTRLTGRAGDAVLLLAKDATTGASEETFAYMWDATEGTWYREEMTTSTQGGMKVHSYTRVYDAQARTIPANGGAFWYVAANGAQIAWTDLAAAE